MANREACRKAYREVCDEANTPRRAYPRVRDTEQYICSIELREMLVKATAELRAHHITTPETHNADHFYETLRLTDKELLLADRLKRSKKAEERARQTHATRKR